MQRSAPLCAIFAIFLFSFGTAAVAGPLEDGITALDAGQYSMAYEAFLKGARAGNAEAQVQLATLLLDGTAGRKDPKAAAQWLEKAANRGHVYAMDRLGTLIEDGVAGKRDASGAVRWYERAIQRGNPDAAFRLAVLYDQGRGVTANPNRAIELYRQAVAGGVLKAKHALGSMLIQRRNSSTNFIEGATWLELALRAGDGDVLGELRKLRETLTATDRAAVRSQVEAHLRTSRHHK